MCKYLGFIFFGFLCACGSGSTDDPPASSAPKLSSLSLSQTVYQADNGKIVLKASGNAAASAYCFKTDATKPLASDGCFQSDASKTIDLTGSQALYYVWGKSASNQVSDTSLNGGSCSSDGFAAAAKSSLPTVCMVTDQGEMVIELEEKKAPGTVSNFLKYVNAGFYSGTVFHRLSPNFVQGGGEQFTNGKLVLKATLYDPITLEKPSVTKVLNNIYSIAMARTSVENSATSGFFINLDNNSGFNADTNAYAAFGRLIYGFSTAQAFSKFPGVTSGDGTVTPSTPPVIQWVIQLK
jgi:peptidyl-prolyl cis-trans isomerase A (cyclophilin A)